jgi:hypothetical protein
VAFQAIEQTSCFQAPNLDDIINGSANTPVSLVIKDNAIHFLRMSVEVMRGLACGYLPNSDGAVIASAYCNPATGSLSTIQSCYSRFGQQSMLYQGLSPIHGQKLRLNSINLRN